MGYGVMGYWAIIGAKDVPRKCFSEHPFFTGLIYQMRPLSMDKEFLFFVFTHIHLSFFQVSLSFMVDFSTRKLNL